MRTNASLVLVAATVTLFCAAWSSGYAIAVNPSPSMPRGVYLLGPIATPNVGDMVAACIPVGELARLSRRRDYLPSSERCASGLSPVLKPVVAVAGDTVAIDDEGTRINGVLLPNSRVYDTDTQGLPITHLPVPWIKRLDAGEYFLLANYVARSLDSRYYGPLPRKNIVGLAHTLATSE